MWGLRRKHYLVLWGVKMKGKHNISVFSSINVRPFYKVPNKGNGTSITLFAFLEIVYEYRESILVHQDWCIRIITFTCTLLSVCVQYLNLRILNNSSVAMYMQSMLHSGIGLPPTYSLALYTTHLGYDTSMFYHFLSSLHSFTFLLTLLCLDRLL